MMSRLQNMRIRTKLLFLCSIMIVGFILLGIISLHAVAEIEVNGPVYHRIVLGKNLIADILPPPAYILESFLTVIQIQNEADAEKRGLFIEKVGRLREAYDERYDFWRKTLPDGPMKNIMTKDSHEPAVAFYQKFDDEFLPAIRSNDRFRANSVESELDALYQIHRRAIDKLVPLARKSNSDNEELADSIIRRIELLLYALAGVMLAAIAASLLGIRQILTNNVSRLVSVTARFSAGDLTARAELQGRDEFSEVGRAFDQMAEKIERDSHALRKNEEKLEKINGQLRAEISERKQAESERNELIAQLKEALAKIKTLTGLLPICSFCKKIRNDKGSWEQMERYIRDHSEAEFSHSICPDCIKKHYADLDLD